VGVSGISKEVERSRSVKMIQIQRFANNPLIEPHPHHKWMSVNVFNPGVCLDTDGLYKMLIRGAYTEDQSMSDLGLAFSTEGTKWHVLNEPVLECGFNAHCSRGIRDARIVKWIDGWWYVFTTVLSASGGKIGIWRTNNFFEFEWVGIPLNQEDTDATIIPEPINGYVYMIHRRNPDIWISRTQDMSLKTGWGDSRVLIRKDQYYNHPDHLVSPNKIGIAGQVIKAPSGHWLLKTHVVHRWDPKITKYSFLINRSYSLSFAVLDLLNPTEVVYVHNEGILWPEERHEIVGIVPNVVFSCATVDPGGDALLEYWGGADTVICGGKLMKKDLVIKISGKETPLFPEYC
jgi:predicted GH43/DUF377 family glycosyl hydrolase